MAGKKYFLLEIDQCPGEAPDAGYPGYFEVEGWNFAVQMESTTQSGAGMGMGRATFSDFGGAKRTDKASTKLMIHCAKGTVLGTAKLVARKQGATSGDLEEFATYEFTNLVITQYVQSGDGNDGLGYENFSFAYEQIDMTYDQRLASGTGEGKRTMGFNSKTNTQT